MKFFPRQTNGYTLIELVIYIGIFSFIFVGIITSLVTVSKTYAQAGAYRHLASDGELVMERLSRELRASTSINTGASTFDTSPGVLALNTVDSNNVPKAVVFSVSNGEMQLTENAALSGALTSGRTTVTEVIYNLITTAQGNAVRIILTLRTTAGVIMTQTFYNTIVLRSEY